MKKILLAFFLFFYSIFGLFAQTEDITQLTNRFLDTVQVHAYNSKLVNWDSLRPAVLNQVKSIQDLNKLQPIFQKVLSSLKDHHSFIIFTPYKSGQESEINNIELQMRMSDKDLGLPPKRFKAEMIDGKYAYINIPAVGTEHGNYIDTMKRQLAFLDSQKPKAWIIDATENHGGSVVPMMWHLYSLVDKDHNFFMHYANGKDVKQELIFKETEHPTMKLFYKVFDLKNKTPYKIRNRKVPIIFLTSNLTSSSGEFVTAYFLGQKNVTVVGQNTMGLTSGNGEFVLNNNFTIILTSGVIKDRSGKIYAIGESISPDVYVDFKFEDYKEEGKQINTESAKRILVENKDVFINKAKEILEKGK